ncbi:phage portal protein [Spartinivicinus ruber]|uniref:phage portal protein n=1 Tax=Spartinivicinus ruber TaxID=2683272 RepID=UPI0013D4A3ED|nr:phage portal protein [Spartinivicinus ruber]
MNPLEKSIALISPSWAAARAKSRCEIQLYEAARPSRLHKAKTNHSDANSTVEWAGKSLRGQGRWLEENHDLVSGLLSVLVNHTVGPNGIGVEPMPLTKGGEIHEDFANTLSQQFAEWSLAPDSSGELTRPELERLVCRTWLRDGECLGEQLVGRINGFHHPNQVVPFSLQVLEPDFLPIDFSEPKKKITQGIQHNNWNQPVAYHVYRDHPGSGISSPRQLLREIPAWKVQHIKQMTRLHQGRGISILAPVIKRLSGLQGYEESELVAARIAAAMAFYIRKGLPDYYDELEQPNKRQSFPIAPGNIFDDLRPGEDVGVIESKRPSQLLQSFRDAMLRAVCSATGANFSTVAKQYDGTYSAQRQELVESFVSYGVLSNAFIARWARPTYRRWVQMATLSGLTIPADVEPSTVFNAHYQPPVMPWIDPAKEAEGYNSLVQGGYSTEAEVIRSRARNPREIKRQRLREIQENRKNNLVFSSDSYHQYYAKSTPSAQE